MKIGIILYPFGERHPAGLARTILEWTRALLINDSKNQYLIFLKGKEKILPDLPGDNWKAIHLGGGRFWLDNLSRVEKADIYVFNTPVMPLFYKPRKSIIIALDFGYLYLESKNPFAYLKKIFTRWYHSFSLKRADIIVSISDATRRDLVNFFGLSQERIKTVYCGFQKICSLPEQSLEIPNKFFLFAGIIKERKNIFNIVKAFNAFRNKISGYKLVIGGHAEGDYVEGIKRYIKNERFEQDVIFLGHLNDNQLSFLYKRAQALVFPSLVEGFGFPVLEAMHCGLPVITSNVSSLAEIGGGGSAILVNPKNPVEIAEAMEKISQDSTFRQNLVNKGFSQASLFSWDKAAREMLEIINDCEGSVSYRYSPFS